ncbi:MAG TPA: 5-oxoprolinase, partial [Planctomycetes bacterium]|nr:5-oxoprolinase [Planctomycetota bacterium]
SQGTMNNLLFGNESFGYYETIAGGAGAGEGFPGAAGVHTHMTNTRITDPEVLERRYPVRLRRFSLRAGSGGAGRFPGGDGVIRELEFLDEVEVSILSQRRARGPYGAAGGAPGQPGRNLLLRPGAKEWEELPAVTTFSARAGDRLRIETPGGGGWGAPERG